ncbi:MAG TPA: ATP synthase F0 subunit C [bacterium]|nr:ATP synthase F0 subunit C [bacterium]HPQ65275.1 ATP synthase F0 subunit C [bacterium]
MDLAALSQIAAVAGAALCMGLGAIGAAVGEGYSAFKAVQAIARQPRASDEVVRLMLVGMAVAESAGIFALFIAIVLAMTNPQAAGIVQVGGFLAAGICMGVGALGPGIGAGLAAGSACEGVGVIPENNALIMRTMLIGQAVSQSTAIYALFVAMLLIFVVGG